MTLVVGRVLPERTILIGDSKLTNEADQRRGHYAAALKPVIVDRNMCVAYAGGAEDAITEIRRLSASERLQADHRGVVNRLLAAHRTAGVDFLVATAPPDSVLTKISGDAAVDAEAAWIGDIRAFAAYQEALDRPRGPLEGETETEAWGLRMFDAVRAVIDDDRFPEVGGFAVRAAGEPEGWEYLADTAAYTGNVEFVLRPGVMTDVPMGGTAEGAFRYAASPPEDRGVRAIGIYFQPGNLGFLLFPRASLYAIPVRDVSQDEFEQRVLANHGIRLRRFGTLVPI